MEKRNKFEEVWGMFLGLVAVISILVITFNYFKRSRGSVTVPGVQDEVVTEKEVLDDEYKVVAGDSLWAIALKEYGDGFRWVELWQDNKELIVNPDLIFPGMKLRLR